ncbi:MAG: hypothetical protein HY763_15400 [Planctomycetes bacterium]|nr:hypothetical protein [Planctomycetota bacterium]
MLRGALICMVLWAALPVRAGEAGGVSPVLEESPEAYEIVATAAVRILPSGLREPYHARLDALLLACRPGESFGSAAGAQAQRGHYVPLDAVAEGPDARPSRRDVAGTFPRRERDAEKLLKRASLPTEAVLPWTILEQHRLLVEAFRSAPPGTILARSGELLHFVTDAALPFNTTRDPDGCSTGALRWSLGAEGTPCRGDGSLRYRIQVELVRRCARRFQEEVRLWPDRFRRVADPGEAAFDLLLESYGVLPTLDSIDASLIEELKLTDAAGFSSRREEYYERLSERLGWCLRWRLEEAALLGANLIGTAWMEAGSPDLDRSPPEAAGAIGPTASEAAPANLPATAGVTAGDALAAGGGFVASTESQVFHRGDCRTVQRIKPENLVRFRTAAEARTGGRTPCKMCRPEG